MTIKKLKNIITFKSASNIPSFQLYLINVIKEKINPIGLTKTETIHKGVRMEQKVGIHPTILINIHEIETILQILKNVSFDILNIIFLLNLIVIKFLLKIITFFRINVILYYMKYSFKHALYTKRLAIQS
ncbi:hypothetical protein ADU81_03380 [Clostridium botulinum]|nr:hypothetical protein ADU81_03380 [Clostridium botulinum]